MTTDFFERFGRCSDIESDTAYLITTAPNRLYATGFQSSDGVVIIKGGRAVFLVDGRYFEAAKRAVSSMEVRLAASVADDIKRALSDFEASYVCMETLVTVAGLERYKAMLPDFHVAASDTLTKTLNGMRSVKTPYELDCIKTAQQIAETAFEHILGFISKDRTEIDIALELEFFMRRNGARGAAFDTIALSGASGSVPHGVPFEKQLKNGELLTMDFGADYKGYKSDMTRTVAIGGVNARMAEVYEIVLSAQKAAIGAVRAGVPACDVDRAARNIIDSAGCGEYFVHSTGHGVGLEIHENPVIHSKSNKPLCAGNIITVEPGIYIEGEFGVRIEDMLFVDACGSINLTSADKNLIVVN